MIYKNCYLIIKTMARELSEERTAWQGPRRRNDNKVVGCGESMVVCTLRETVDISGSMDDRIFQFGLPRCFWNRLFHISTSFRVAYPLPQVWKDIFLQQGFSNGQIHRSQPELVFCWFNKGPCSVVCPYMFHSKKKTVR